MKIKEGDIVGRKSYGKDIIFIVNKIKNVNNHNIAILKGLTIRVEADADIEDLEIIKKEQINSNLRGLEQKLENKINEIEFIFDTFQINIILSSLVSFHLSLLFPSFSSLSEISPLPIHPIHV